MKTDAIRTLPFSSAYDRQDTIFARAFQALEEGIAQKSFPGAAIAVTYRGEIAALKACGRFTYDAASTPVAADTIYDLASVTKVVATTAAAMVLYERDIFKLGMPLAEALPEFAIALPHDIDGARRESVTLRMLLAHSSGLPAYARLFEHARGRGRMLRAACSLPLEAPPGTRAAYSDIGFLLLGEAITRLAARPLSLLCQEEIFGPLGMTRTGFRPPAEIRSQIPPTERSATGEPVQGEVQDENARAFGLRDSADDSSSKGFQLAASELVQNDAGHAGVFAPAIDVARFAECMLNGGAPILRPETVKLFTRREISPPGTSRALGWDTPSAPSQSGHYFSALSFGHLGYAGTSLWIDPERRLSVTLLTNRTWPDRQSQGIKQVRPRVHDAVVCALQ